MVKTFALIAPRHDVSREKFHSHWMDPHGALASEITLLRGYVQNHRLASDLLDVPNGSPFEGVAAIWIDDLDVMAALAEDPEMIEATADQPNFMDVEKLDWISTTEDVLLDGSAPTGVKVMHMIRRAGDLSPAAFASSWKDAPAAAALRERLGVVREARCVALAGSYGPDAAPPYDAVHEVWWPDMPHLWSARAHEREAWDELFGGDGIDSAASDFIVAQEHRVI